MILFFLFFSPSALAEMKGWELYCWQGKSAARYSLLPGTNRLKTESEILQDPLTLLALEKKLSNLEKGAQVTIEGGGVQEENPKLVVPPAKDEAEILSRCRLAHLNCVKTE